MILKTGDWMMSGPLKGTETLLQLGIKMMGSVHTHDELIIEKNGQFFVGSAEPPHFLLVPYEQRVKETLTNNRSMAVFRWHEWIDKCAIDPEWSTIVKSCILMMAEVELPYDSSALRTHARNWIRVKLGISWLPPELGGHRKDHVYCTENCFMSYRLAGTPLESMVGNPVLPAPVHSERLVRQGYLRPIINYGLTEHLGIMSTEQ